jgi:predicted nucleotidyltransferase component of viral defense system
MATIKDMIDRAEADGYKDDNAEAKVCQDIVLKALAQSRMSRNTTIKGGVVMRSISRDSRRATQDMDIDFIRYSLDDESIKHFIRKLDCLEGLSIKQTGSVTELNQQEYHGKRVFIVISDETGDSVESKIDLGVHKNLSIEQEEYCFDIAGFEGSVNLLINSKEQMFVEKLRSLLRFGQYSTRFKDIFDMCYLSDLLDVAKLRECMNILIFDDSSMRENNMSDVRRRISNTFRSSEYMRKLATSRKNWLGMDIAMVTQKLEVFLGALE